MKRSILDSRRQGGYILYTRHAQANIGEDQPYLDLENCLTQRNLSNYGRQQAVYFGEILRYLQIPIETPVIISSPFCRNKETAELAFGRGNVEIKSFWSDIYRLNRNMSYTEQERIIATLQDRLSVEPPSGTNAVIVAHSFPAGIGLGPIPNMGTVIVRPHRDGYEVVASISLEEWGQLVGIQ